MGTYGGTAEASMSNSNVGNVADINLDRAVDLMDFCMFDKCWPLEGNLMREDFDRSGKVDENDLYMLADNWLWPSPE